MASTSNLVDVVRHYQRSIDKHDEDEQRLLHCITKLFNLPIKFEHLQETGIGKTVNALRKFNGEVGVAAKTLVSKWKAMVAAEEEPAVAATPAASHNEEDSGKSKSSDEDPEQENKGSNSSSGEDLHSSTHKSKHAKSSKHERSGSSKSHSKSKSDSDKKHKSSRHDKSKDRDKDKDKESHKEAKEHREKKSNGEHKSKDSSKSSSSHKSSKPEGHKSEHSKSKHEKDKSSHSESKPAKDKSSKHKSSSSSKSSKRSHSPQRTEEDAQKAKIPKIKSKSEENSADGFDSSMGANFDDVLGLLNMPMSSKKSSSGSKSKFPSKPATAPSSAALSNPTASGSSREAFSTSSRPTTTKKPELLASTAKLEPLDPNIALELPTISNNYKPLPLNQTVMDVVFNQGGSQKAQASRYFNESEALAQGISSKTMRTKIYSGVRTGQILQVPSLFDLCTRVLQKNIDALEYTGGVPFEVLRPVLERATPQQLLNFEEYNPYLMDDSDVLWQLHVQRHCRSQRREEMETWREMFLRCQEEKDRKLSILAESIKASQKISEAPVRKTQLAFVDSMVKPPRSVQRKQEQYGTKGKLIATPAARVAALSSVTPNAAKVGDARLRVLAATRDTAQVGAGPGRSKKAPLMAKTLQFMRGRHKR
ncbi:transcription elongation factor B polypeptide 3 [Drosophila subpulchrella]|uniref:transcription elongation factor B polypeptide 3 n=1 Tax=Drosophila subpulchrella TaxID=1486046 RepID=UPI0018A15BCF|nr:transcription elongation factor B polypeptide 3 [Drosophila subpulchrella]